MSEWGWTPERNLGIWRHGAGWLKPVMAAVPYVTVCVLLLLIFYVGELLPSARGVLLSLPEGEFADAEKTGLVAIATPVSGETRIFFDDARYLLNDESSLRNFSRDLAERAEHAENKSLLLLADRRISSVELLKLVARARQSGVDKVLVAGKRGGEGE